jgi:hypothetical protein
MDLIDNKGRRGQCAGNLYQRTDQPHGNGRMEYYDFTYEGRWVDGDWSGFGKLETRIKEDFWTIPSTVWG